MSRRPLVTVIILNWNGKEYLESCLPSVDALDYPRDRLEIMVVDNNSTDGSVEFVRENYPRVILVRKRRNEGYARPNNDAARLAGGSHLAFLNNDVRVERDWLEKMIQSMRVSKGVVCVASKMLSWDGERIDYAGGTVSFEGRGFQAAWGHVKEGREASHGETLFPCSGAMLIQKEAFLETGGFDEDLGWHFVDVDLGWRLWVQGYRVAYNPTALAYHVQGGDHERSSDHKKDHLIERNGILTAVKNLADDNLHRVLPASLLLQTHRATLGGEILRGRYEIDATEPLGEGERLGLPSVTPLVALHSIAKDLPLFLEKRKEIQSRRRRSDEEILSRFGEHWGSLPFAPLGAAYRRVQDQLFRIFDIGKAVRTNGRSARRILIISSDYVGEEMAGPAIRCWEFAKRLAPEFDVTLAIPNKTSVEPKGFRILPYTLKEYGDLQRHSLESDIILLQGYTLYHLPFLKGLQKIFIVDLYCPFPVENLNLYRYNDYNEDVRKKIHSLDLIVANEQILMGDFFLCANERQRDYWLGVLTALNRLNVETFDNDTSLEKMIATVPFGMPDTPPAKTRRVIKGVVPGVREDDKVIIWAGGIFNWFDPETLILAMKRIEKRRPDLKLFFLGTRHPNPGIPAMKVQEQAILLAKHLGLFGRTVIFNEKGYVPYEEREEYLLDSDFGVSTHRIGVESRLANRTRFMDYLWAGLPIVCTEGDSLAEMVSKEGLGVVVPDGDPDAVAEALIDLASDPAAIRGIRERIHGVRQRFTWSRVVDPLKEFCRNAAYAPDKGPGRAELPPLLRLHRELELKEDAITLVTDKLENQDQARRKAEDIANQRLTLINATALREQEMLRAVQLKDQHIGNLEHLLHLRDLALAQRDIHVRNIETLLHQGKGLTVGGSGEPGSNAGLLKKLRRWLRRRPR